MFNCLKRRSKKNSQSFKWKDFFVISCSILSFIALQEFGDSARARKLYEQESDDDDDDEIEPNPKLEQGKFLCIISTIFVYLSNL